MAPGDLGTRHRPAGPHRRPPCARWPPRPPSSTASRSTRRVQRRVAGAGDSMATDDGLSPDRRTRGAGARQPRRRSIVNPETDFRGGALRGRRGRCYVGGGRAAEPRDGRRGRGFTRAGRSSAFEGVATIERGRGAGAAPSCGCPADGAAAAAGRARSTGTSWSAARCATGAGARDRARSAASRARSSAAVLVVEGAHGEVLVPLVAEICVDVDAGGTADRDRRRRKGCSS